MFKLLKAIVHAPFAQFFFKKTALFLISISVGLTFIFIFPRLLPYSPIDIMIGRIQGAGGTSIGGSSGSSGGLQSYALEAMRKTYEEKFGLTQPPITQYFLFLKRFLTMDFGLSYYLYPYPVESLVLSALPWTLALIVPVMVIGFGVGNWVGARAAYYRGRVSNVALTIATYMTQAPYYWFALILMLVFGVTLGWFPLYGAYSSKWLRPVLSLPWILDAVWHYALPFLSLVSLAIGGWAIDMRALALYEMQSNYIEYCEHLGFAKRKLRRYVQKNAILPNFTWIPLSISSLVSQTLLVEVVFGYPGLGSLAFNAVFAQDYPLIEVTLIFSMLIVLIGNFICDVFYGVLDPRIGSGYVGGG